MMPYCNKKQIYCEWAGITGECCRTAPCKFQMEPQTFIVPEQYEDPYIRQLRKEMEAVPNQTAKKDAGKIRPTLVPPEAIRAIARVRMYGITKYTDPDNWKKVEPYRYLDATFRHLLDAVDDLHSKDKESGLPHIEHALTNLAFLCALAKEDEANDGN